MSTVQLCETFTSLQGESTYAGLPCLFIRLAECNLRCSYCDTQHAYAAGTSVRIDTLVKGASDSRAEIVEVTGGEPLLQPAFSELAGALLGIPGKTVLVETNGSLDISVVPEGAVTILDVKCPCSGESERMDLANLSRLRYGDEVKFVVMDEEDYQWAKELVLQHDLAARCAAVLFSPVYGQLDSSILAEWILNDELPVRLQVQLHKLLGLR